MVTRWPEEASALAEWMGMWGILVGYSPRQLDQSQALLSDGHVSRGQVVKLLCGVERASRTILPLLLPGHLAEQTE